MKKNLVSLFALAVCLILVSGLCSCGSNKTPENPTAPAETSEIISETEKADAKTAKTAVYSEDTELGEGEKTFVCKVTDADKTVTFTIKTDADTVGAALLENNLIAGDESEYGLYVKEVNGITADYDADGTYWAFYINGEYAMTGVDGTAIEDGAEYTLVIEKG